MKGAIGLFRPPSHILLITPFFLGTLYILCWHSYSLHAPCLESPIIVFMSDPRRPFLVLGGPGPHQEREARGGAVPRLPQGHHQLPPLRARPPQDLQRPRRRRHPANLQRQQVAAQSTRISFK